MAVCLSVHLNISETTQPNLTKFLCTLKLAWLGLILWLHYILSSFKVPENKATLNSTLHLHYEMFSIRLEYTNITNTEQSGGAWPNFQLPVPPQNRQK